MPTESKAKRKLRRLKRQNTIAYRLVDIAIAQRNQARTVAGALELELKKYTEPTVLDPNNFYPEGEDPTPIVAAPSRDVTIVRTGESIE